MCENFHTSSELLNVVGQLVPAKHCQVFGSVWSLELLWAPESRNTSERLVPTADGAQILHLSSGNNYFPMKLTMCQF